MLVVEWWSSGGDVMLLDVAENWNLMYEKMYQNVSKMKNDQKTSKNIKKDQQKRPPKTRRPASQKTTKDKMTR